MSDVIGVGVDLCSVPRIARAMEREHFMRRVYTQEERAYLKSRGKSAPQSAAAMFAAKEAVAKALGTGFSRRRCARPDRRDPRRKRRAGHCLDRGGQSAV